MPNLLEIPKPKIITAFHETAAALPHELGDKFQDDPFAVQQALLQKIGAQVSERALTYTRDDSEEREYLLDLDKHEQREATLLIKLERYSIIKACVDLQHEHMVEGEGLEARFKDSVQFDTAEIADEDLSATQAFSQRLNVGYEQAGKEAVIDRQPWFAQGIERNRDLFRYFTDVYGEQAGFHAPATADDLVVALAGGALISVIPHLVDMVNTSPVTGGYSPDKKLQTARELSYIGLRQAAQNMTELIPLEISDLQGEIVVIPNGPHAGRHIYSEVPVTMLPGETTAKFEERKKEAADMAKAIFGYKTYPGNDQEGYPISDLDEALWGIMLKCPVFQPTKEQPISNLHSQQHAALQKSHDYDLFQ